MGEVISIHDVVILKRDYPFFNASCNSSRSCNPMFLFRISNTMCIESRFLWLLCLSCEQSDIQQESYDKVFLLLFSFFVVLVSSFHNCPHVVGFNIFSSLFVPAENSDPFCHNYVVVFEVTRAGQLEERDSIISSMLTFALCIKQKLMPCLECCEI